MIRLDCEQRSPEWRLARAGVVTASCADKLITPKTMKPSASAGEYLNRLLAEWLLGGPLEERNVGKWTDRGTEMEGRAFAYYALERDVEAEKVGFLLRDDRRVGCSPDALVGEDGGLEMKVPAAHTHVGYMRDHDSLVAEYRGQVQLSLLVTGRRWWDLLSFNPTLPSVLVRVKRDDFYVEALEEAIESFLRRLDEEKARFADVKAAIDANPFSDAAFAAAREADDPFRAIA